MAIDFGKQVGPLPLGAWMVVVGGGLAIAYWQRNSGSDEPEIVEDTGSPEGVGEGPGWVAVPPPSTPPTESGPVKYETNEAWGQAAINWLIAQGYSPGIASSAITKALNGGASIDGAKMSIQEWSLWSLALTKFGSPPYPVNVAPPTSVPGPINPPNIPPVPRPPAPKPPTAPPSNPGNRIPPHHVVKAKRGDTVSSISKRYGQPDWRVTWNFNLKYRPAATAAVMKARGPNLIFAGTTIWVPK